MRQLALEAPRSLRWINAPEPQITSGAGAIVRPVAVGVCGFDKWIIEGASPMQMVLPIIPGHEIVAEVTKVGGDVRHIRAGMRVVLPLHMNCGTCPDCNSQRTNLCSSRPLRANYGLGELGGDWGGGMSDLLYVPYADAMAVELPPGVSAADCAAVGCNLVDVYRSIAPYLRCFDRPSYLVAGGPGISIGLYAVAMARALGVADIGFLDDDPARLAAAERLGAHPIHLSEPIERLYPIVADCSRSAERQAMAMARIARGGFLTMVSPFDGLSSSLPIGDMFRRSATFVTGQPHARAYIEPVLDLIRAGKISSTSIPSEILPWDAAKDAYGRGGVKQIFVRY